MLRVSSCICAVFFSCLVTFSGVVAEEPAMHKVALGKPAQLKFVLSPEPRCSFGDLDVISLDNQTGKVDLQLSVEEFGGKGNVYYGEAAGEKESAYHYSVSLPAYNKPTVLGVYLCSVKKGGKSPCGKFPVRDYNELLAPYKVDITQAEVSKDGKLGAAPLSQQGENDPSGKVYFFKFIVLDGKGNATFPQGRMTSEAYDQILASLEKQGAKIENGKWQMNRIKIIAETIGSEPLEVKDGSISLMLPFYQKEKCTK